jgi:autotransporter passenger strand-loop-strand repeat protein
LQNARKNANIICRSQQIAISQIKVFSSMLVPNYILVKGTWQLHGQINVSTLPYDEGGGYDFYQGTVPAGQTDGDDHISSASLLTDDGTTIDTVANSDAQEWVYGTANGTTLDGGGQQVYDGGSAINTTINADGFQFLRGGTARGTVIRGVDGNAQEDVYAGTAIDTTVNDGGAQNIYAGGFSVDTVVSSGGYQGDGGTATGTIIYTNGSEQVLDGGKNVDGTLSGGYLLVYAGGTVTNNVVLHGGVLQLGVSGTDGGTAISTTIDSGGLELVASSGTDLGATINDGGVLSIDDGASLQIGGTFDNAGTIQVNGGSILDSASISGSGAIVLDGGTFEVQSSATFSSAAGPITFDAGSTSTLKIDGTAMPTNLISGFVQGDTIDLAGVSFSSAGTVQLLPGNVLEMVENGATYQLHLGQSSNYAGDTFQRSPNPNGGTDITVVATTPSLLDYFDFSALVYQLTPGAFGSAPKPTLALPSGWIVGPSVVSQGRLFGDGLTAIAFIDTGSGPTHNDVVIAFRGSVTAHDFTISDASLAAGHAPAEFGTAITQVTSFEQTIESDYPSSQDYSYFVTGHSLGGAEAEYVAAVTGLGGDTFAAPGVSYEISPDGQVSNGNNLTDYVIVGDLVGMDAGALTPNGQHIGKVIYTAPVVYPSTLFVGAFGFGGVAAALGVGALMQHLLYSYGQSLFGANNPLSSGLLTLGGVSLNEIYPSIRNLITSTDSSGDVTQSGMVDATTSEGTAIETVTETATVTGALDFSAQVTSGTETASQTATIATTGLTSDKVVLDGINISTPLSQIADINVAANGTLLVGTSSPTKGDELTIDAVSTSTDVVSVGGDAAHSAKQIDDLSTQNLSGASLYLSASGAENVEIGVPTVIQTDGTTSLAKIGNNFSLFAVGTLSGPELQINSAPVVAGVTIGPWVPIGAVQTATGYDVAFKDPGDDEFTVWATNGSGNYVSNLTGGAVSGTSAALENLELVFHQDLNGDGVIGPTTIPAGATVEIPSAYSGTVRFGASTGTLQLDNSSSFSGTVAGMTGQDKIDLRNINFSTLHALTYTRTTSETTLHITDGTHSANIALLGNYLASTFVASSDGHGGTDIVDPHLTSSNQHFLATPPLHA